MHHHLLGKPGIHRRLFWMTSLTMAVFVALLAYLIPAFNEQLLVKRQDSSRFIVEASIGILKGFQAQEQAGALTQAEAQRQAMKALSALRYEGANYIWIQDSTPVMVMHPMKPELDGKPLGQIVDSKGGHLFIEFAKIAKEKGSGFHLYTWPKPGEKVDSPKASFVQFFAPWGWIVGSGLYLDDVAASNHKMLLIAGLGLLAAMGLTFLVSRQIIGSLAGQMQEVQKATEQMAQGDLRGTLHIKGEGEIADMAKDISVLMASLRQEFAGIAQASERAASGAVELSATSHSQTSIVQEVSRTAGVLETSNSQILEAVSGMAFSLEKVESAMGESKARTRDSLKSSEDGQLAGDSTLLAMEDIQNATKAILAIADAIRGVAVQANLLSLNAGIEAASAGVAGRGFAIVAGEIRKLAERSAEAARSIRELIERTDKAVARGNATVETTVNALRDIRKSVDGLSVAMDTVGLATQEQAVGVTQVQKAVSVMSDVVRQNKSVVASIQGSSEHIAQTSSEVAAVADSLAETIRKFKT